MERGGEEVAISFLMDETYRSHDLAYRVEESDRKCMLAKERVHLVSCGRKKRKVGNMDCAVDFSDVNVLDHCGTLMLPQRPEKKTEKKDVLRVLFAMVVHSCHL